MKLDTGLRTRAVRTTVFALLTTIAAGAAHPQAASVWVADEKQVHRVDAALGRIAQSLPLEHSSGIALDGDGVVWVLGKSSLVRLSPDGSPAASTDLKAVGFESAILLAAYPGDVRVWIADEKRVAIVDAQGTGPAGGGAFGAMSLMGRRSLEASIALRYLRE